MHTVIAGAAQDAVCRGTFQNNPGGGLRSSVVLQSALEIASAMAFLHSHGIVHGVRLRSPPIPTVNPQCTSGMPCISIAPTSCKTCIPMRTLQGLRSCAPLSLTLQRSSRETCLIREPTPCSEGCSHQHLCYCQILSLTPCMHRRTLRAAMCC